MLHLNCLRVGPSYSSFYYNFVSTKFTIQRYLINRRYDGLFLNSSNLKEVKKMEIVLYTISY